MDDGDRSPHLPDHSGPRDGHSLRSLFFNGWIRQNIDGHQFIIVGIENTIREFLGFCFISLRSSSRGQRSFMAVDRRHTLWDISQFLSKTNDVSLENGSSVRLWLRFFCLKDVYSVKTERIEVTADQVEEMQTDPNRWVEVPNDYEQFFTVGDLEKRTFELIQSEHIEIAVNRTENSGDDQEPRRLQIGSIVDVQDRQRRWNESVVRHIQFDDDDGDGNGFVTARVSVHYIGWDLKWDEIKTVTLFTKDSLIENMAEDGFLPKGTKTNGPKRDSNHFIPNPKRIAKSKFSESTMGGVISWRKMADFSSLLPREIRLKLWNGVWRKRRFAETPEVKGIKEVLRTFALLHLTREYNKRNERVPQDVKDRLSGAVTIPSEFISGFLKRKDNLSTMLTIFKGLKLRFVRDDEKMKATEDNFNELMADPIGASFNREDFLKTAYLQYLLYAFAAAEEDVVLEPIF